jgi:ribosomal protein S18 acetylase RimI-like enzyme
VANPSADVALNLVLTAHDKPVGMVSATAPSMDGEVELISLWVAPAGRGRGVGDEASGKYWRGHPYSIAATR